MRQFLIIATILCIAAAAASPKWHQLENYTFEDYVRDFSKSYVKGTEEYLIRKTLFSAKLASIRAFNAAGNSYKKGIN